MYKCHFENSNDCFWNPNKQSSEIIGQTKYLKYIIFPRVFRHCEKFTDWFWYWSCNWLSSESLFTKPDAVTSDCRSRLKRGLAEQLWFLSQNWSDWQNVVLVSILSHFDNIISSRMKFWKPDINPALMCTLKLDCQLDWKIDWFIYLLWSTSFGSCGIT